MARRDLRRGEGLRRRGPSRDPLPLMLVVCEGSVTERQYINAFRLAHGASTVRIRVEAPGGDPRALVQRAIELRDQAAERAVRERDENIAFDEVWCVFDVDQHARLQEARGIAEEAGIQLAVSNPCFELWLILHFSDHGAHLSPRRATELLKRHLAGYEKHIRFEGLSPGYEDAVRRAEALDQRHAAAGTDGGNPSTGVYRLTERVRQFGKATRS